MKIYVYIAFLSCSLAAGFLLQDARNNQTSGNLQSNTDMTVQYLLGLIVDEKNSRHQLENIITLMGNKIDQMEKATAQKEVEMVNKLNEMSTKYTKLERNYTIVSREFQKERNNRENLEQLFDVLEKRLENVTTEYESQKDQLVETNFLLKNRSLSEQKRSVGFSAMSPVSSTGMGDSALKFQNLIFSTDHGYNLTTGVFTCEWPGLYFFTMTVVRHGGTTGEATCYFGVNGTRIIRAMGNNNDGSSAFPSGSASIVYNLNTGDTVMLFNCNDNPYYYTTFSGFLVTN